MTAKQIQKHIRRFVNRKKAKILRGFFKTGPGEYGEGDIFLGIQVPTIRQIEKQFRGTALGEIKKLIRSPIHEERLLARLMLVHLYAEGDGVLKEKIYDFYVKSTKYINNWNLVVTYIFYFLIIIVFLDIRYKYFLIIKKDYFRRFISAACGKLYFHFYSM